LSGTVLTIACSNSTAFYLFHFLKKQFLNLLDLHNLNFLIVKQLNYKTLDDFEIDYQNCNIPEKIEPSSVTH